jgi:hypothetical protein
LFDEGQRQRQHCRSWINERVGNFNAPNLVGPQPAAIILIQVGIVLDLGRDGDSAQVGGAHLKQAPRRPRRK